jgi:hypothetical protein
VPPRARRATAGLVDGREEHVDAARVVPLAGAVAQALEELERVLLRKLRNRADLQHAKIRERGGADIGKVGERGRTIDRAGFLLHDEHLNRWITVRAPCAVPGACGSLRGDAVWRISHYHAISFFRDESAWCGGAINDLQLERLWVVHQETDGFEMRPGSRHCPSGNWTPCGERFGREQVAGGNVDAQNHKETRKSYESGVATTYIHRIIIIMVKTLTKHGNSYALVIDRAILELLQMDPERPVELTTDGNALTIRPMTEGTKGSSASTTSTGRH